MGTPPLNPGVGRVEDQKHRFKWPTMALNLQEVQLETKVSSQVALVVGYQEPFKSVLWWIDKFLERQ